MEPIDDGRPLKPFMILWSGQALSLVGSQAVQFALVWWLTVQTGSAAVLATAAILALLPHIVLGPFAGALIDRWNRKAVLFGADVVVALASVVLAALFARGMAETSHVFVLLFVRAVGGVFHSAAMIASTSLMVPPQHLTRIQGLNQAVQGGQIIVSAPLGALLYATLPMAGVMGIDVATALVAVVPLIWIRVPQPAMPDDSLGRPESLTKSVATGARFLLARRGHTTLLVMGALVNFCMVPAFTLLPLLVIEHGGNAMQLGGMTSVFGVGTLVGGIALGVWGGFSRKIYTTCLGLLGAGAATLLLGVAGSVPVAWIAMASVGLTIPWVNGPIVAILQSTIPAALQGRVFTLYGSVCAMMTPLGLALAAPIAESVGVRAWYVAGGAVCLAMGTLVFLIPSVSRIEQDSDVALADDRLEISGGNAG